MQIFLILYLSFMSFLSQLSWRYATKKFDTDRKISDTDIDAIIEAIRLAPTSYWLQPSHFYVVTNQDIKDKIQAAAWNQSQIGTCSHLIIFAARTDFMANKDEFFDLMSGGNADKRAQMNWFENMLTWVISSRSESEGLAWSANQAYIAIGFALAAAAELEIDSCPMEWADFATVGDILWMPPTHKALVMLPLGYRAKWEAPRTPEKVRFSREALFTEIQ